MQSNSIQDYINNKIMEAIKVSATWFYEYKRELLNNAMNATRHINDLRQRIEEMKAGRPTEHDKKHSITLEKLLGWLDSAPSFEAEKQKLREFEAKYTPCKELKGDLKSAKSEVLKLSDKILSTKSIHDESDPYKVIGDMQEKYFLSNKQTDLLMAYMSKLELLY